MELMLVPKLAIWTAFTPQPVSKPPGSSLLVADVQVPAVSSRDGGGSSSRAQAAQTSGLLRTGQVGHSSPAPIQETPTHLAGHALKDPPPGNFETGIWPAQQKIDWHRAADVYRQTE